MQIAFLKQGFRATLMVATTAAAVRTAGAQGTTDAAKHPAVCAAGVIVYHDLKEVPVPHDTISIPPASAPVRVTSPAEAEAAELDLRARAGSVGATAVLVVMVSVDEGGGLVSQRRRAFGIFVPADFVRAQKACGK